jgi:hypothetical protein
MQNNSKPLPSRSNKVWKGLTIVTFSVFLCALGIYMFYEYEPSGAVPFNREDGKANYTYIEAQSITEAAVFIEEKRSNNSGLNPTLRRAQRRTWIEETHYYLVKGVDGTFYIADIDPGIAARLSGTESAFIFGCPAKMPEHHVIWLIDRNDPALPYHNADELYAGLGRFILYEGWSRTGLRINTILGYTIGLSVSVAFISAMGCLATMPKKSSRKFSHAIPPVSVELFDDGTFSAAIISRKIKGSYKETEERDITTVSFMYGNNMVIGSITNYTMTIPGEWDVYHGQGTPFTVVNLKLRSLEAKKSG